MARVDTVAGASICILMEEVMLTQYIFPLKKQLGQKTKITEISVDSQGDLRMADGVASV
uniref:Uncharacterized protein n=1 Tax=Balaenoptera musculus TaxID=9771 RepID=A0A8C0CC01_BALMU